MSPNKSFVPTRANNAVFRQRRARAAQFCRWAHIENFMSRSIAVIAMIPAVCLAVGADSTVYIGGRLTSTEITLHFISDPQPWSAGHPVYGSKDHPKLRYCWESGPPQEGGGYLYESFQCSSAEGAAPVVTYRYRAVSRKELKKAYKTWESSDGDMNVFVCEEGCSDEVPTYFFSAADDDC